MHIYGNVANGKWPGNRKYKNNAPFSQSLTISMLDKNLSHLFSGNLLGIRFVGSQAVQGKQGGRIQSRNHLEFSFSNSTPEP